MPMEYSLLILDEWHDSLDILEWASSLNAHAQTLVHCAGAHMLDGVKTWPTDKQTNQPTVKAILGAGFADIFLFWCYRNINFPMAHSEKYFGAIAF